MNKVIAPFNVEQVKHLNEYQAKGEFHPFTCCSPEHVEECQRKSGQNEGKLIARHEGWICPCGMYTQNWAHYSMSVDHFKIKTPEEY